MFFTPLPIFFAQNLGLPANMIFMIYMLNSVGAIVGYSLVKRRSTFIDSKKQIRRIVILRSALIFLLVAATQIAFATTFFAALVMVLLNLGYAVYYILMISLAMELIPDGKAGIFDVLTGLGAASGSLLGPFLAQTLGVPSPIPNRLRHLPFSICNSKNFHLRNSHKKRQTKKICPHSTCTHALTRKHAR